MSQAPQVSGRPGSQLVWDVPTRLFHWTLVLLIGVMWWTGEQRMLDYHRLAGYALTATILFRLLWGFAGSQTARFASFVRGPADVYRYVRSEMFARKDGPLAPGHNPLGGWSVVVMLAIVAAQICLGMISVDVDGIESGPLSWLVDFDTGRVAADAHGIIFYLLLAMIGLHVLAVLGYLIFRGDNLTGAMVTGGKRPSGGTAEVRFASPLRALLLFAASAGIVAALVIGLGG